MRNAFDDDENNERGVMKVKQTIVVGCASPHHKGGDRPDDGEKQHVTPDLSQAGECESSTQETRDSKQENDDENQSIWSDGEAHLKARAKIAAFVQKTLREEEESDPFQHVHGAIALLLEAELEAVADEQRKRQPGAFLALAFDTPTVSVGHDS